MFQSERLLVLGWGLEWAAGLALVLGWGSVLGWGLEWGPSLVFQPLGQLAPRKGLERAKEMEPL